MRCLYFVQEADGGPIKIGVAADPVERLRGLQIGNPRELTLLAYVEGVTVADERSLHRALANHRISGEWFEAAEAVLAAIDAFIAERGAHECAECERQTRRLLSGWTPVAVTSSHTCGKPRGFLASALSSSRQAAAVTALPSTPHKELGSFGA